MGADMPVREDILKAAASAFSERGYATATLDDVARIVGIQKPSLYHHIRSKEELLVRIQERLMQDLWTDTRSAVAESANAIDRVKAIIEVYMKMNAEHPEEVKVVVREFRALTGNNRECILQRRREYLAYVQSIVQDGIDTGEFRPVSARLTALAILGILTSAQDWYSNAGAQTHDEIADAFAGIVTEGLIPTPSTLGDRGSAVT